MKQFPNGFFCSGGIAANQAEGAHNEMVKDYIQQICVRLVALQSMIMK